MAYCGDIRISPDGQTVELYDGKEWRAVHTPWHLVYQFMHERRGDVDHAETQIITKAFFQMLERNGLEIRIKLRQES